MKDSLSPPCSPQWPGRPPSPRPWAPGRCRRPPSRPSRWTGSLPHSEAQCTHRPGKGLMWHQKSVKKINSNIYRGIIVVIVAEFSLKKCRYTTDPIMHLPACVFLRREVDGQVARKPWFSWISKIYKNPHKIVFTWKGIRDHLASWERQMGHGHWNEFTGSKGNLKWVLWKNLLSYDNHNTIAFIWRDTLKQLLLIVAEELSVGLLFVSLLSSEFTWESLLLWNSVGVGATSPSLFWSPLEILHKVMDRK